MSDEPAYPHQAHIDALVRQAPTLSEHTKAQLALILTARRRRRKE